jgi:hypothetical protein
MPACADIESSKGRFRLRDRPPNREWSEAVAPQFDAHGSTFKTLRFCALRPSDLLSEGGFIRYIIETLYPSDAVADDPGPHCRWKSAQDFVARGILLWHDFGVPCTRRRLAQSPPAVEVKYGFSI